MEIIVQRSSRRIRTLALLMVLCSVLQMFGPVSGQWAQTLGWGGAGYGKRSLTRTDLKRENPVSSGLIRMLRDVLQLIEVEKSVIKGELTSDF